jgi:hypothetical protein
MPRSQKIKKFRDQFMGYIHGDDHNYEAALRFLMNHEHEVFEEMAKENPFQSPMERNREAWRIVFNELTVALSPWQVQQLFECLSRDFLRTGMRVVAMAESQKLLQGDLGGEAGGGVF